MLDKLYLGLTFLVKCVYPHIVGKELAKIIKLIPIKFYI